MAAFPDAPISIADLNTAFNINNLDDAHERLLYRRNGTLFITPAVGQISLGDFRNQLYQVNARFTYDDLQTSTNASRGLDRILDKDPTYFKAEGVSDAWDNDNNSGALMTATINADPTSIAQTRKVIVIWQHDFQNRFNGRIKISDDWFSLNGVRKFTDTRINQLGSNYTVTYSEVVTQGDVIQVNMFLDARRQCIYRNFLTIFLTENA